MNLNQIKTDILANFVSGANAKEAQIWVDSCKKIINKIEDKKLQERIINTIQLSFVFGESLEQSLTDLFENIKQDEMRKG